MIKMLGIAIPCYEGHFDLLPTLIENISMSTVRPDQIAISCSSWKHNSRTDTNYKGIPVSIQYSKHKLNQATNRNIAGSMLNTKYISFIDADDLMHPSRIEYILNAFSSGPYQAIYHGYSREHSSHYGDSFNPMDPFKLASEKLVIDPNAYGLKVGEGGYEIQHAHVTVTREVFNRFKFNENWNAYRLEDSLYGRTLVENGVQLGYIANKLVRYIFTTT
jgi:glycosyltransferase involved in cell wall biosynthesis